MVDYDKRYKVPSETISTYKFGSGETLIIKKQFTDYLHPRTGAIMKRVLEKVSIEGHEDLKPGVLEWITGGYIQKVPKAIKRYMEELK